LAPRKRGFFVRSGPISRIVRPNRQRNQALPALPHRHATELPVDGYCRKKAVAAIGRARGATSCGDDWLCYFYVISGKIYDPSMPLTPAQSRAARNILGWTQQDLADAAGLSIFIVRAFERDRRPLDQATLALMRRAFEGAGVEFPERDAVRLASKR
jgi:DNA-binding XRE family transcriptional regulator